MTPSDPVIIDFAEITDGGRVRNISGHGKGVAARKKFGVDEIDASDNSAIITVPDSIYAVSVSFTQGFFGETLKRLGSKKQFFDHYSFECTPLVLNQIIRGLAFQRYGEVPDGD